MAVSTLREIVPSFFFGPNGERLTPDQIRQRQLIAASLRQQATDTSPNAGGWASILSKGILGLSAGLQEGRADRAAQGAAEDSRINIGKLLGLSVGDTPTGTTSIPDPVAQGELAATSPAVIQQTADADYIRSGLISRGFSPQVADGFLANFQDESGLNPGINEASPTVPGSRGGFGLYQLTGPRRVAYEQFAAQRGVDPSDVDAQLDFLKTELEGPEAAAAQSIFAAKTTPEAAQAIVKNFLRPAPEHLAARSAAYAGLPTVQTAPVPPVEVASLAAPQTATDAINTVSPVPAPYTDPTVTNAYAPQQPSTSVAQALTQPVKGGRLGSPQPLSDASFNDRFGSVTPQSIVQAAQPMAQQDSVFAPELADVSTQPQVSPTVASQLAASSPQPVPVVAPQVAQAAPQRQPLNIPQAILPTVRPLNPAVVQTLSNPYASPEERSIASSLLQKYQGEKAAYDKAVLSDRASRQAIQQRVGIADQLGIDRNLVLDEDAWKQAVTNAVGDAPTAVVNGVVVNTRTGQPIYGAPEKPTSVQEYEYYKQNVPAGQPVMSYQDYEQSQKRAGAQSITVGGGGNTQVFDAVSKSADSARAAVTGLNALREAKQAVSQGIISGTGADARLGLQKVGALLGVADPTVIQNTETFRSAIAPQVAAVMKATVGSTQISDADRSFAQKAAGGDISLDKGTIIRLLDIMERAGSAAVKTHNERLDKIYPEGQGFDRERALFMIDEPAPMGQPQFPNAPPVGTVQQGFKFKGGDPANQSNWEQVQ